MSDLSRVEQLLRNALGEDIYEVTPQSRVEALLVELNELIEGMDSSVNPEDIATAVSAYLDEHLTNTTNPPIDTSLSISGAAADAKKTGDEFTQLKSDLIDSVIALSEKTNNSILVDILSNFTIANAYLDKNNGQLANNDSFKATETYIDLFRYPDLYITAKSVYSSPCVYVLYDNAKNMIYYSRTNVADFRIAFSDIMADYPAARYIRVSGCVDSSVVSNPVFSVKAPVNLVAYEEYVTPEMFGAFGDGETDDSTAFQAAANQKKPMRLMPGKTYLIESPVDLYNSLDGQMSKIVFPAQTIRTSMLKFTADNISIENLFLESEETENYKDSIREDETLSSNVQAIQISGSNISIRNVYSLNVLATIYFAGSTENKNVNISGLYITSTQFGVYFNGCENCELNDFVITGSENWNGYMHCLYISAGCKNIRIANGAIYPNASANSNVNHFDVVSIHPSDSTNRSIENIYIDSVTIKGTSDKAFVARRAKNVYISNVTVSLESDNVRFVENLDSNVNVSNSYFENVGESVFVSALFAEEVSGQREYTNYLISNTIFNLKGNGAFLRGFKGEISNCVIRAKLTSATQPLFTSENPNHIFIKNTLFDLDGGMFLFNLATGYRIFAINNTILSGRSDNLPSSYVLFSGSDYCKVLFNNVYGLGSEEQLAASNITKVFGNNVYPV